MMMAAVAVDITMTKTVMMGPMFSFGVAMGLMLMMFEMPGLFFQMLIRFKVSSVGPVEKDNCCALRTTK